MKDTRGEPSARRALAARRRWSGEDDRLLADLHRLATPIADISAELDRTESAIHNRLHTLRKAGQASTRSRGWEAEDDEQLLKGLAAGRSVGEVATDLGRGLPAVRERRRQLLTEAESSTLRKFRAWTSAEDQLLVQRYNEGQVLSVIADELQVSLGLAYARLQSLRAGGVSLPPRRPRWTAEEKQRLADMYRAGTTYRQLTFEFGRSHGSISTQLRQLREAGVDLRR